MTDRPDTDQAARIRRLQERRGTGPVATSPRAKHPATASRIVAVGVALASFFTVVTAFGLRQNSTGAAGTAVVPATAVAPTPVPTAPAGATPPAAPTLAPAAAPTSATPAPQAAPVAAAPAPAPVQTTTRGS
jgi:hypothetical protein